MRKKVVGMLCSMTMAAALLSGCAGEPVSTSDESEETAVEETAEEESAESAEEEGTGAALNIAIVTALSGVDDGSFNQNNYEGIQAFIEENPESKVTAIKEETGDTAKCYEAVENIVADYDVIVCCGYQFAGIGPLAEENPDVDFILVDSNPNDADGNEAEYDNVYGMTFKEQESGFLAGVAAAMSTQTGKVAVVNGIAYPSNVNYEYGFMSGVNYSNKHFGTSAEIVEEASYAGTDVTGVNVGGNYVGSFGDEATGKVLGETLINDGADVIFVAAGASGNGVFTAVKEASSEENPVYVIGCDVDQYNDGVNGDSNIILTSVLKVMDKNVKEQLEKVADGTFEGGNVLLGADTDSTGYVSDAEHSQLSEEAVAKIDEAYAGVKDGTIVPASNFGGTTPDDFVGLE
jgi:basic membrane protein A and related proteins